MSSNRLNDIQVEVQVRPGEWFPGWLDPDEWRQVNGRWRGFVRWSRSAAEQHLDHFDEADIRKV